VTSLLMQELALSSKGSHSASPNLPSPTAQAHITSLNHSSRSLQASNATNGANQPNVPACKLVCIYVCQQVLYVLYVWFI